MSLGILCYLFWFPYSFSEYCTILLFVTFYAYQMQIQMSCFHPHRVLFLLWWSLVWPDRDGNQWPTVWKVDTLTTKPILRYVYSWSLLWCIGIWYMWLSWTETIFGLFLQTGRSPEKITATMLDVPYAAQEITLSTEPCQSHWVNIIVEMKWIE